MRAPMSPCAQDLTHLRSLIQRHVKYTNSTVGRRILLDWDTESRNFVKVNGDGGQAKRGVRTAGGLWAAPCRCPLLAHLLTHAQVWPREFRRAMDEATKLKAAQAAEAELLKDAGGVDAFEELKKMAVEGAWGEGGGRRRGGAVDVGDGTLVVPTCSC